MIFETWNDIGLRAPAAGVEDGQSGGHVDHGHTGGAQFCGDKAVFLPSGEGTPRGWRGPEASGCNPRGQMGELEKVGRAAFREGGLARFFGGGVLHAGDVGEWLMAHGMETVRDAATAMEQSNAARAT